MNLPSEERCMELFGEYKVPGNILQHCLKVREVAVFLAHKFKENGHEIDVQLVSRLALLHDLFKVVGLKTLSKNKFHDYEHSEEEINMWKELREKYPQMHEGDVAHIVFKDDYPELAQGLKNVSSQVEHSQEEKLVHYADWRIFRSEIVSLQDRLGYLMEVYPGSDERWKEKESSMIELENEIMEKADLAADEIAEHLQDFDVSQIIEG